MSRPTLSRVLQRQLYINSYNDIVFSKAKKIPLPTCVYSKCTSCFYATCMTKLQRPFRTSKKKSITTSINRLWYSNHGKQNIQPSQKHAAIPSYIVERLHSIEDSLRFHGYSTIRWGLALITGIGLTMYIFREYIRSTVVEEVSHVASRSLGDEMVKTKAQELSVALLHAILDDKDTQDNVVLFLQDVFSKKETQQAASTLVINVLKDPSTLSAITAALKSAIHTGFSDDSFRNKVLQHMIGILHQPEMQVALIKLVIQVLHNEQVITGAKELAVDVVSSDPVINTASDAAKSLVEEVVQDSLVQKKAGDGLYKAFKHSVTPRIFSWGSSNNDKEANRQNNGVEDNNPGRTDENPSEPDKTS